MKKVFHYLFFDDYELSTPISILGNILAMFTALSVCVLVTGFLYMISWKHFMYYVACGISLLFLVVKGGISINKRMLLFYTVIILNVLVLPIDPVFRAQQRAMAFIFVTMVCSPVLESETAVAYRERVFKYVLIGFTILTVLSFFCFFLGINMMPYNREGDVELYDDYINNGGKFSGLFNHSMIFGPIAAIVSLVNFNLYMKNHKSIRLILFVLCSVACVFSASRAALLALASGFAFVLFKGLVSRKSYISFGRICLLAFITVLAILPIADIAFSGLMNKIEMTQDLFGGNNSREWKYESRLYEFKESPLLGVGFASIDTSTGDAYDMISGRIEPGSAHLAVLAQTGLVGMLAYIVLLIGALKVMRKRSSLSSYIAYAMFWLFFAHGWGEGWIFAPGGMICFMFWLSLSQCYDLKFKESVNDGQSLINYE